MVRRLALIAIVLSSILAGGVVVWFALTIPNDVRAESLLRDAQSDLKAENHGEARTKLEKIVRNHPRTDAAATALIVLLRIQNDDRAALDKRVKASEQRLKEQTARVAALEQRLTQLTAVANKPPAEVKPQQPPQKLSIKRSTRTPEKRPVRRTTPRRRRG